MSTFFNDLTKVSNDDVGATDLINYLLKVVGHDVCSFRCNALTSYRIINKAGELYQAINTLAKSVDTDERDEWENYDKYTTAIHPLEEYVLWIIY